MKIPTRVSCILSLLASTILCFSQEWVAWYNGPNDDWDEAHAIAIDEVGNVIVTGRSDGGSTNADYATVSYNPLGVEQWVARYNGPHNSLDIAAAIAVDHSRRIYVTGASEISAVNFDYTTVQYDSLGVEQWVARYNGPGDTNDKATAIAVDSAGNIYVTGWSFSYGPHDDYATVKYDTSGTEQWVARYNGPGNGYDRAYAIAIDNAGNIYVTGESPGSGTFRDYATVKYDASGAEHWVVRYDGPGSGNDRAVAAAVDNIGCVYVTGWSSGSGTHVDYATVKYDSSGVEQWVARYNGLGNEEDFATAIALDAAGNVYVTGWSYGPGDFYDYATVKYNTSGVEQWVARYSGSGIGDNFSVAVALDSVGNVYVTGASVGIGTNCDYATVKYDSMGLEQWVARYNGPGNAWDGAYDMALDNAGNVYVTGTSVGLGPVTDYATIKYSPTGVEETRISEVNSRHLTATILSGPLQLPQGKKCKVFDITGRIVNPDEIQPGIYFIEVDGIVTLKVVKVR